MIVIPLGLICSLFRSESRRSQPNYHVFHNGVPIVTQRGVLQQTVQDSTPISDRWAGRSAEVLGSLHVVTGVISMVFGGIAIAMDASQSHSGTGIWAGFFYALTGTITLLSGKYKTRNWITWTTVLAWLALGVAFIAICLTTAGLVDDTPSGRNSWNYWDYNMFVQTTPNPRDDYHRNGKIAMNGIILACALVESILAIWIGILGCNATTRRATRGVVVHTPQVIQQHLTSVNGGHGYAYDQQGFQLPPPATRIITTTNQQVAPPNFILSPPAYQQTGVYAPAQNVNNFSTA